VSAPEVTIVMPVRNEERALDATLDAVLAQDLAEPFEVVVAEGASTDGTRALLERRAAADPRIRLVDNPTGATAAALNRALEAARGRYLVRVDGHSLPPRDYVRRLVEHLRSGACEAAGGRKRAVGSGAFGRAVAEAHGSRFGIGDSKYHYSDRVELVDHVPFGAYLTGRARALGGWDEELVRNQDYEFDYRYGAAGGRILLDPSIVVDWQVRERPGALARQYYGYGFWKLRSLARHPGSLHLRWLVPPALVAALAGGAAASPTAPGRWLLTGAAGSYGAFLAAGSALLARRSGPAQAPRLAAALAVMHLSWGAGFLASAAAALLQALRRRAQAGPGTGAPPSPRARRVRA
jgi:glycosyltransferase involved in cell wall biosynthesis